MPFYSVLSSVLTNADLWTGLRKNEVKQLEDLDSSLLRQFLGTPCTVPTEAVYLELGVLNIGTILKSKRINFLHTLLKQKENSMLYNFFLTQWKYPGPKDEWTEQVKVDLNDFGITDDLDHLQKLKSYSFKNMVRRKAKEFALMTFLEQKEKHSKLDNLYYTDLKLQPYLNSDDINETGAKTVFSFGQEWQILVIIMEKFHPALCATIIVIHKNGASVANKSWKM